MSVRADRRRLLIGGAALLAGAAALTFIVDLLQIFRPARLFAAMYSTDTRLQNAGLIQSQDFDTVFMGTSLAIHFRQRHRQGVGRALAEARHDRLELT